jgi:hypothetical protein
MLVDVAFAEAIHGDADIIGGLVQRNGLGSALVASIIDASFDIGSELPG